MNDNEKLAELNALICEAQAISIEVESMKVENTKTNKNQPYYNPKDFVAMAQELRAIADKIRKLGGTK